METFPSAKRFLCPHVTFSEMLRLSSCARAGHDRNEQLALGVQRVDVFLLEVDLDALFLELAHGSQAVHGVAGEAGDGLGDDEVYLSRQCVGDHLVEAFAPFGIGAGDALVGVHPGERPVGPFLDVMGVVVHLRLIAGELFVAVGGDAGVCRHPALLHGGDGRGGEAVPRRGQHRDPRGLLLWLRSFLASLFWRILRPVPSSHLSSCRGAICPAKRALLAAHP